MKQATRLSSICNCGECRTIRGNTKRANLFFAAGCFVIAAILALTFWK